MQLAILSLLGLLFVQSADPPLPDVTSLWWRVRPNLMGQYDANELLKGYTYHLSSVRNEVGDKDKIKNTNHSRFEIYHFDHGPFSKLISMNGVPISEKQARRQDEDFEKFRKKKPGDGFWPPWAQKRTSKDQSERLDDLYKAFDFKILRREVRNDRSTIVVAFKPRQNPTLKTMAARMFFRKIEGTAWIDEQDARIAKLELRFLKDVKMAFGLMASVSKDTETTREWIKVNDEIWLPLRSEMRFKGRMFLAKGYNMKLVNEYSDYKKFSVETTYKVIP